MDKFNRMFQKSTENTTCELHREMCRLTKLYAANVLKTDVITSASGNLRLLNLERESQLDDENLGVGIDTWTCIRELEEEHDPAPFFSAVRKFYTASLKKMLKKFPFGDSLLKDFGVLQPDKTASYSVDTIVGLAKRFPQLELSSNESLDKLKEEFLDFQLSPGDLPPPSEYKAADLTLKPRVGAFWSRVSETKTLDGRDRFSALVKLMYGLMSVPCSNADSERGFSILRKIHTDQRSNLDQSTIIALMSMKFNCDDCCHDSRLSSELLTRCKKATRQSLHKN